jgi:hypothetical protein
MHHVCVNSDGWIGRDLSLRKSSIFFVKNKITDDFLQERFVLRKLVIMRFSCSFSWSGEFNGFHLRLWVLTCLFPVYSVSAFRRTSHAPSICHVRTSPFSGKGQKTLSCKQTRRGHDVADDLVPVKNLNSSKSNLTSNLFTSQKLEDTGTYSRFTS